ncbi:MAG: hypothetical protein GEEBNDBF_01071 [bacterium]|nr:hypothetical protein [bacterium]
MRCETSGPASLARSAAPVLLAVSAQGKTPRGHDPWVRGLEAAVESIRDAGDSLLAGSGPLPWDLTLRLAARAKVPVVLITTTPPANRNQLLADFGLCDDRVQMVHQPSTRRQKRDWQLRDDLAWQRAAKVCPISLRPGGRLASRLLTVGKGVDRTWEVPWERRPWVPELVIPDEVRGESSEQAWLVHWTRRRYSPWPGETPASFCDAILESDTSWPRDAPATLERILREGRLRASGFRASGGVPVVSFSAATPAVMRTNFRWCARKVAPMWEPLGIAVLPEMLRELGGEPVQYGQASRTSNERWRWHGGGSFVQEHEWRVRGDLDLSQLPSSSWRVIVPGADWETRFAHWGSVQSWGAWIAGDAADRHNSRMVLVAP